MGQSERRNVDLDKQVQSLKNQLEKAETMETKYLTLWHSVVDLWNKWSRVRALLSLFLSQMYAMVVVFFCVFVCTVCGLWLLSASLSLQCLVHVF